LNCRPAGGNEDQGRNNNKQRELIHEGIIAFSSSMEYWMKITDQIYSNINDGEVKNRISKLGKNKK